MKHTFLLTVLSSLIFFSCKTVEPTVVKSSQKEVTDLTLTGIANVTSTFDQATNTYTFTVPTGTNIKALAFTFTLPTGATSIPTSGSTQDFTNPITYAITAEDGSKQSIKVSIVVQAAPKSSEKKMLTFSLNVLNPVVTATIDEVNKKITATVPANTNLTSLIPTITSSPKSTVSPVTGVAQNFTNSVNYTITAEDGSTQVYSVTILKEVVVSNNLPKSFSLLSDDQKTNITLTWNQGIVVNQILENTSLQYKVSQEIVRDKDGYIIKKVTGSDFVEYLYSSNKKTITQKQGTFTNYVFNYDDKSLLTQSQFGTGSSGKTFLTWEKNNNCVNRVVDDKGGNLTTINSWSSLENPLWQYAKSTQFFVADGGVSSLDVWLLFLSDKVPNSYIKDSILSIVTTTLDSQKRVIGIKVTRAGAIVQDISVVY
jgi:hypothetical protein